MSQPAAAFGDAAAHSGLITIGSTNVLIGGRLAARVGDAIMCPFHGVSVITQGSASVFINGMPAARMGDLTGCLTVGLSAISIPVVLGAEPEIKSGSLDPADDGKTRAQHDSTGTDTFVHAEYIKTDADHDGKYDTHDMSAQFLRVHGQKKHLLDRLPNDKRDRELVIDGAFDMARVDVKHVDPTGIMGTSANSIEASMYRGVVSVSKGAKDRAVLDPDYSLTAQGDILHAKAEHESIIGADGKGRYGLMGKAEASAQVASADATIVTTPLEYEDYDVKVKMKRGISGGAIGGGAGAWGYLDTNESRFHFGANALLKVLIGFEMEWDVSIGKKPALPPASTPAPTTNYVNSPGFGTGGIPGTILLGNPTVLIG